MKKLLHTMSWRWVSRITSRDARVLGEAESPVTVFLNQKMQAIKKKKKLCHKIHAGLVIAAIKLES